MGTSKGYGMPTGGEWTPLKKDFTKFGKNGETPTLSARSLIRGFVRASGGADGFARGGGGDGGDVGGGGGSIGRAARSGGQRLGGFLSSVAALGLDGALREAGLTTLIGRPASEVVAELLDFFMGSASTLDEAAACDAFTDLTDELLNEAATYEDMEQGFSQALDERGVGRLLAQFFANYIYRLICRGFYEKLLKQEGAARIGHTLKSMKETIRAMLDDNLVNRNVAGIKWTGAEGKRITERIFQDTLQIYETPA